MKCPNCGGNLKRRSWSITEGCFSAILAEIGFWMIAGFIALFIYKLVDYTVIAIISFILLVLLAHYLDRKLPDLKCESCASKFKSRELKKKFTLDSDNADKQTNT